MTRAALCVAALGALAACEVPLDPIAPSDLYFSMSGYLDASSDTQWVRVEPLAPTADPRPDPLDAAVTLTDVASGAAVPLTQEVRPLRTGPAHLFWTTADVALGGRYRLAARRADGAVTAADVVVPADGSFEVEVVTGRNTCPTTVTVSGAERVVDVQARYVLQRGGRRAEYRYSHAGTFVTLDDGSVRASVYYADDASRMGLDPLVDPAQAGIVESSLVVAVSTAAWPDLAGLTLEDALLVESFGVENGLGFVGGAVTERHPYVPGIISLGFGAAFLPCTRDSAS